MFQRTMHPTLRKLEKGDKRSIGQVRWHVAQMLPRLELTEQERRRVFRVLLGYLNDPSSIVRTFAMQALVDVARESPALLPVVRRRIRKLAVDGTPAMKARGRKLLKELATSR